jgi:NADPH-dependent curcumin reductase CurA
MAACHGHKSAGAINLKVEPRTPILKASPPAMVPETYTRIALAERPKANFDANTLRTETRPFSELKPGAQQALVQVNLISLDPAMRTWVGDARGYMPSVPVGSTMRAWGIATVLEAGAESKFKVGDLVMGYTGLTEYARMDDATTLPVK